MYHFTVICRFRNPVFNNQFYLTIWLALGCIGCTLSSSGILESTSPSGMLNSFNSLAEWAEHEREIYSIIKTLWESRTCMKINLTKDYNYQYETKTTKNVEAYIENFESSTLRYFKNLPKYDNVGGRNGSQAVYNNNYGELAASNLVLLYQMTHRLAKYGETLQNFLYENRVDQEILVFKAKQKAKFLEEWPGDLENDVLISTLLWTYKRYDMHLKPDEFVRYLNTEAVNYATPTAEMAYGVAQVALAQMDYVQAFDWLNYAVNLTEIGDGSASKKELLEAMKNATIAHNTDKYIHPEFDDKFYTANISYDENNLTQAEPWVRNKDYYYNSLNGTYESDYIDTNMWVICAANESLVQESLKAKLKCYHETKTHPWLFINPLRVEVLTEIPGEILLFHDILGNKILKEIVESLDDNEKDFSGINGSENDDEQVNTESFRKGLATRSSINTWFEDDQFPELTQISEIVSGLKGTSNNSSHSEAFQAVEYVVGRYYAAHLDATPEEQETYKSEFTETAGARTATLLFYLNDVEKGGQTVFLNSGVVSMPRKGSAVFWKNVYKNGTIRDDTWHASCPVMYGRKLVINKWFRSNIQFRSFPCSLNPYE